MRFKSRSRALAASALAASLGLAGLTLAASPAQAVEDTEIVRVSGATRYGTASAAASTGFPEGATNVVLASGEKFPDALAAGGLAGTLDAPILLTPSAGLSDEALAGLEDLGAENVTIMGGTDAVSADVVDALEDEGYTVDRIAGDNRFETAADIATEVGGTTAVLANGFSFADALAISPGAHELELPVLLTGADELSAEAAGYIDTAGVEEITIVGGTDVVSQDIEDALEADGVTVTRLAGINRYETAVDIAEFHLDNGFSADELVLATGEKFADALAGGPMASQLLAPMILTQTDTLTGVTGDFIEDVAPEADTIYILGGPAAVSDAVEDAAAAAAQSDGTQVTVTPVDDDTTITAGQSFAGTLTSDGGDITNVAVSGPCVTSDSDVDETDAAGGTDFDFAVPVDSDADEGSCTITFTVTVDGEDDPVVVTQVITVEAATTGGGGGGTPAPELADFFVDAENGSDDNDGTASSPFASIAHAIDVAEDGDSIQVADGTYDEGTLLVEEDLFIVAADDGNEIEPLVQGTFNVFNVTDGSLVGFEITDFVPDPGNPRNAIRLDNVSSYLIQDNVFTGSPSDTDANGEQGGNGIVNNTGGDTESVTIEGNRFRELRRGIASNPSADFGVTGNDFTNNVTGISSFVDDVITDNSFDGNTSYALALSAGSASVEDNFFDAGNAVNIGDFTEGYFLEALESMNSFAEPQEIDEGGYPDVIEDLDGQAFYVDAEAADGGDGSLEDPFDVISDAVSAASDGDRIIVADGTYTELVTIEGKNLDVMAADDGNDVAPVVEGTFRIFNVTDGSLVGFEITDFVDDPGNPRNAIRFDNVSGYAVHENVFTGSASENVDGNFSDDNGNGIVNNKSASTESVTISRNWFRTLRRGVVSNQSAEFEISENHFSGNVTGISSFDADLIFENSFDGNTSYAVALSGPGATVILNSFGVDADNVVNVGDFVGGYDLDQIVEDNDFAQPQVIDEASMPRTISDEATPG